VSPDPGNLGAALVVNGVAGRMGRLVAGALAQAGLGEVAGCDPAGGSLAGIRMVPDLVGGLREGGVVVDFSHPSATSLLVRAARERQARLVVGTTGQDETQLGLLREVAASVPVVLARNFSLGISRILQVLPQLRVLVADGFDVECMEAHHRGKRDAPSGTALALLQTLLGPGDASPRVHGREGRDAARRPGEVGIHSLRQGGLPGEHALVWASDHEVVEIRHRALDRTAFVSGVLPAVRFVRSSPPGLYSMLDVLRHAEAGGT